ncbi:MAG: HAMP domain-containing histidine kinase [Anaerolineae bacterium]|nr:HAMP domain-containing histidine kinase [Anaerolineae bacterium]
MLPKSIRWRLPLTYAGIALLASIVLGAVLLTTLRGYYTMRERENLYGNAQLISEMVARSRARGSSDAVIAWQINTLSFISQARIQLFDEQGVSLVDSGNPAEKQVITLEAGALPPDAETIYFSGTPLLAQPEIRDLAQRFWVTRADQDNLLMQPASPVTAGSDAPATFSVAVAGTPFGIGLRRELNLNRRSDESVMVSVHDRDNNLMGSVEVSNGPAYGTEIIDGMTSALVIAGAVAVVLAAGAGWVISRAMTQPLLILTRATARMAEGQLSTRVALTRSDEFGTLAHSFDEMAQRVEATVVALRRFVADAAHQIHTPLTAVHADLELAASEPDESRQEMFIQRAMTQLKRLEALTNDLLDLSRLEAHIGDNHRAVVDLVLLVREISESFASRAEQAGIAFNIEAPDEPIRALVNETQFRHAIGNLLDNAIKFTPENGMITVCVRRVGESVELTVNDTGIGIAAEDLSQLFNRFHRGRNAAPYPGSGLGLAIIKAIIDGHHGQISVESSAGRGTQFALRIPAGIA